MVFRLRSHLSRRCRILGFNQFRRMTGRYLKRLASRSARLSRTRSSNNAPRTEVAATDPIAHSVRGGGDTTQITAPDAPETDPMKIALIPPIDITPEAAIVAYPKPIHTQSLPLNRYPQGAHKSMCQGLIEMLKYTNRNTVLYCTDMDFYPAYNAFMSSNPKCKLRVKEGYVKSTNVSGTGKKATSVQLQ